MEESIRKHVRITLALALLFMVVNTSLPQERFSLKSFVKYCKSSKHSIASNSQRFARSVHYVRWIGDDKADEFDYQIVCNKDRRNAYFAMIEDYRIVVFDKKKYIEINNDNNDLISIRRRKKGRMYYSTLRYNDEKNHCCLHYYLYNVMNALSMPIITSCTEEIVRNKKAYKYTACEKQKATASNGSTINITETKELWIDFNTLEIDSVIEKRTNHFEDGKTEVVTTKEYVAVNQLFDFDTFEKLLDFDNPKYKHYSRRDENNLPYRNVLSENKEMNDQILNFPIVNLTGETITIREQSGWLLLDFWQFGCPSCFAQFKKFAQENDSLGSTILEQNKVSILSIHPYSDNMDKMGQIGEKYKVSKYLYSAKGMNGQLEIVGYPTYYLISPDKEIVLKLKRLEDYSKIIQVINNHK